MRRGIRTLSVLLGAGMCSLATFSSDSQKLANVASSVPAKMYGYDVAGEVHDDATLPVRSIVFSDRKVLPERDGLPVYGLSYRVCNIEAGDTAAQRAPSKLYFQWPDAGFRTALKREVPFETCVTFDREVTAEVKQVTSDILYTYAPTAIPANSIWVMKWTPPWTKPTRYWSHGIALFEDLTKGLKNPKKTMLRIHNVRKGPNEKAAYQLLGWTQGTELYLALPKLSAEEMSLYRTSLGRLEGQGVRFSIRPGQLAAQDFNQDAWVAQGFAGRDVLKVDLAPNREKDNQYQQFQVEVPVSTLDLIQLSAVLRERQSGRAMYQAMYVISGN